MPTLPLQLSALLAFALGLAHSLLGERYILVRLFRRPDLPRLFGGTVFTTRTLRFAWHLTTLAWWGLGAVLLLLGGRPVDPRRIALAIGLTFLASGLAALAGSRGRHLAWIVFLLIGGLVVVAAIRG